MSLPPTQVSGRGPISILKVAAGNGRVGVELRGKFNSDPGIKHLVATDHLESVRFATVRDRNPNPHGEYIVADLIALSERGLLA